MDRLVKTWKKVVGSNKKDSLVDEDDWNDEIQSKLEKFKKKRFNSLPQMSLARESSNSNTKFNSFDNCMDNDSDEQQLIVVSSKRNYNENLNGNTIEIVTNSNVESTSSTLNIRGLKRILGSSSRKKTIVKQANCDIDDFDHGMNEKDKYKPKILGKKLPSVDENNNNPATTTTTLNEQHFYYEIDTSYMKYHQSSEIDEPLLVSLNNDDDDDINTNDEKSTKKLKRNITTSYFFNRFSSKAQSDSKTNLFIRSGSSFDKKYSKLDNSAANTSFSVNHENSFNLLNSINNHQSDLNEKSFSHHDHSHGMDTSHLALGHTSLDAIPTDIDSHREVYWYLDNLFEAMLLQVDAELRFDETVKLKRHHILHAHLMYARNYYELRREKNEARLTTFHPCLVALACLRHSDAVNVVDAHHCTCDDYIYLFDTKVKFCTWKCKIFIILKRPKRSSYKRLRFIEELNKCYKYLLDCTPK